MIALQIRSERSSESAAIRAIIQQAFASIAYSLHNEHDIVDALRAANELSVSLIAIHKNEVVGYCACSPVNIDGRATKWVGLGPIGVRPDLQGHGVGSALMHASIEQLKLNNAEGIVLLGNPAYYSRFGFRRHAALRFPDAPAEYFLTLPLHGSLPNGIVRYHEAFDSKKRGHIKT